MNRLIIAAIAGAVFLSTGCASNKSPSFGEALMNKSGEARKISKDWNAGDKLATKGANALEKAAKNEQKAAKLQQKAQKLTQDAAKLKENGTKWSAEGATKKADAEARYQALRAAPIPVPAAAATDAAAEEAPAQ